MMKRILSLLLVLSLLLLPTTVFAQDKDAPFVFCGDLDEETCNLLHQSQAAMKEVASSVQDAHIDLSLQNVPNSPVKDASVQVDMANVIYVDPAYVQELEDMMANASEAMADDMHGFMQDYMMKSAGLYSRMALDMQLDIQLSDEIADFATSQAGFDMPTDLTTDIRLVDGILYINLDDISSALPDLGIPTGWYGIEIARLMEEQMSTAMAELENPSEQAQAQMAGMMVGMSLANISKNEALQDALNEIVIMDRLDDGDVNGVEVAQLESIIDFNALLTNETVLALVFDLLKNSGQDIPELDNMDPAEVAGMLQLVAPMLTQGLDLVVLQQIGLDDGYVYGSTIDMSWDMSSVIQLAAMGSGGRPARRSRDKTIFELHTSSQGSDFNDAPEIVAPEDAMVIPLEALQ